MRGTANGPGPPPPHSLAEAALTEAETQTRVTQRREGAARTGRGHV